MKIAGFKQTISFSYPLFFFAGYFAGWVAVCLTIVFCAASFIAKKRQYTAFIICCAIFAIAGQLTAIRDKMPIEETQSVSYADKKIIRLDNGRVFQNGSALIPESGDKIRFSTADIADSGEYTKTLADFTIEKETGFREQFIRFIEKNSASHLLLALTSGKIKFTPQERNSYVKTGTMHIVAISAVNIGVLFLFLIYLQRIASAFIPLRPRVLLLTMLAVKASVIVGYLYLTGMAVPTVRAALFILFFDIFLSLGINANQFFVFFLSLISTALLVPCSITSASFIMTALCVFSVIMLWNRLPASEIVKIIAVSVLINFILLPVTVELSGYFSLLSPLANLVVLPLFSIVMPITVFIQALYPFMQGAAQIFVAAADILSVMIEKNIMLISSVSDQWLMPATNLSVWAKILFYFLLTAVFLSWKYWKIAFLIPLICLSSMLFYNYSGESRIEKIYALPTESYCVYDGGGYGRIIEKAPLSFMYDYVKRKNEMLPLTIERDMSRCGILNVTSMHFYTLPGSSVLTEIMKRPRFAGAQIYIIKDFKDTAE